MQGVIQPSIDSHIEFEVWLPASGWNGKYLGVGNGGFAGGRAAKWSGAGGLQAVHEHPFTPTAQDGFEFVADPKSTVTNFAQIGHEHNLADALATGYAASTPGTLLAGPLT